jgi:polyhydroxyalkanoate synthesis regulator phasin
MDDLFKKFINTGVGFLSQGNKRVQTALDKLVKESKISEQEGKKIMDDLLKSGEAKRKDLEKQLQTLAGSLKDRVSKSSEAAATPKAKAAPKKAAPAAAKAPAPAKAPAAKKATAPKAAKAKKAAASPEQE